MTALTWGQWIRSSQWARDEKAAIPTLPSNISELVVLAVDPEVAAWRIAAVVGQDPVLAAQVIRMANTVGLTPGRPVTTIEEAVRRLGSRPVRNVVLAGCLSNQMADPRIYGTLGRRIVDHSLGTATLAAKLAENRDLSGEMFLAGLLHDIGKLLVLKLAHEYTQETGVRPPDAEIEETLRTRHAQLGGWLAVRWCIPSATADCIVWHHEPEWAGDYEAAAIIYTANRLAHRYGFGGYSLDRSNLLDDSIVVDAGLTSERLTKLDLVAPDLFADTRRALPA